MSKVESSGIGFFTLLGLVFITLKLCNVIDWSWWWVLMPFWGSIAIIAVVFLIAIIGVGIAVFIGLQKW